MNGKECFLISTSHLSDRILFRNDDDFKAAMNIVAIAAFMTGITILDFVLMSNHVHFVVLGDYDTALKFVNLFKSLYALYAKNQHGIDKLFRKNEVDIRAIPFENESLERVLAYVQANPVAANICPHPSLYQWGCGQLLFNTMPLSGRKQLREYSFRAQTRILHSNVRLPQDYVLSADGYIVPSSYVPVNYVEGIFRTAKRYNFFLINSSKARARMEDTPMPSFRDQVIDQAISDLCHSLYRKERVSDLCPPELGELLRQIRRRFNADIAQLARITGIPYSEISSSLDSF